MFEGLKSAIGLTNPDAGSPAAGVDAVTHRMLQDLNLPDPGANDGPAPAPGRRNPLEEARAQVEDWLTEGRTVEDELDIVFEALFDTQAQAQSYLMAASSAGFDDFPAQSTRKFAESIAATILVSMIPAPEDLARIEAMLAPLAEQNGGVFDGYYLDGQQQQ